MTNFILMISEPDGNKERGVLKFSDFSVEGAELER
jgi:hypothetical protein